MREELGYEVTPKQSLDGLWRTMHKYIEHHGYSDISLELEGSQYEFRQHLKKYDEYEAKAEAFDRLVDTAYWHLERIDPEEVNVLQFESFYKDIRDEIDKYESGESE